MVVVIQTFGKLSLIIKEKCVMVVAGKIPLMVIILNEISLFILSI